MNEVSNFLRTIPEDRSDIASSSGFRLPPDESPHHHTKKKIEKHRGSADQKRSPSYEISSARSEANSSTRVNLESGASPGSEISTAGGTIATGGRRAGDESAQAPKPNACQSFWTKRKLVVLLASLTLIAGVIVAIVFVGRQMSGDDDDSLPREPDDDESTVHPSMDDEKSFSPSLPTSTLPPEGYGSTGPDMNDVDPETQATLDSYLLQIVSSEEDLLNRTESSQYKARQWMLYTDLLRDDVLDEGARRVHQRFALVQLYFSTNGDEWTDNFSYLSPDTSECRWLNVTCEPNQNDRTVAVRVQFPENNLRGTLPEELSAGLPSLEELILSGNSLSGTIPSRWFEDDSAFNEFFNLDLSRNALTGSIPEGLWSLPKIRFVYLAYNHLSGALQAPSSEAAATPSAFLQDVFLYDNLLTGPLPDWFSNAPSLQKWVAWSNQVSGSLPTVFPPLLSHFDMSGNAFSGTLPASLFSLPELRIVYLDGNRLSGPLPDPGNVTLPLEQVWLHNNTLSGPIPDDFGFYWPDLGKLLLYDNPALTGVLGQEGVEDCRASGLWVSLERLEADCIQSGGGVVCDCCTNLKCL